MSRPTLVLVLVVALGATACVTPRPLPVVTSPRYPDYPVPVIPPSITVEAGLRTRHDNAWQRLQGGELEAARQGFEELLRSTPGLYPSRAGLGFVALAEGRTDAALEAFDAVVSVDAGYLPAWLGRMDVLLALGRDADAVAAMERILELDPARDSVRGRLELVRFRVVQQLIAGGQTARREGRLDEARAQLEQALELSPSSGVILQELVAVERAANQPAAAERYAREAVTASPGDPEPLVALAEVLAGEDRHAEAAEAYRSALALDPRPDWSARFDTLRVGAALAAVPGLEGLPEMSSVSRAQVAAYVAIRLEDLLQRAPVRITEIATDIRTHWASSWIVPVTRSGVMAVYPNHTFQPDAPVSRGDLATVVATLLELATTGRPDALAGWRAARPEFVDLPPTNVRYDDVALAVAADALSAGEGRAFRLAAPASGRDLVDAVGRVADLTPAIR